MSNKTEPKNQNQHILPQVYLKQFTADDSGIKIKYYNKKNNECETKYIENFLCGINMFDINFKSDPKKRFLENTFNRSLENEYRKILNTIEAQKKIIPKHSDILNHFIASIFYRTSNFRSDISIHLENNIENLVKIIDELHPEKESYKTILQLTNHDKNQQVNIVLSAFMNSTVNYFRGLNKHVVVPPEGGHWMSSDNPVIVLNSKNQIFGDDSEIIFPLSRKYCLYLSKHNEKDHIFTFKKNCINQANKNQYDTINTLSIKNSDEYLF